MSNMPLVSIVVPTHNRRSAVTRCVRSVLHSDYERFEVVVVDDASTDGTGDDIKNSFPSVRVIRLEESSLVSESRNIGCKSSKGDLVFFVDDDNVVDPHAVTELVKVLSNKPGVGIAGPIMYYLCSPEHVWCSGVSRNYWTSITRFSALKPNGSTDCYQTEDVPNSFMVRRRVFSDVGYFDKEQFAQHMEEADFCQRARQKGYRIVMAPKATVWHDVPVRSWPYRGARNLHISSSERAYYVARNRILFMRKYAGAPKFVVFALAFLPLIALSHIAMILNEGGLGEPKAPFLGSYIRGLIDGFDSNAFEKHESVFSR